MSWRRRRSSPVTATLLTTNFAIRMNSVAATWPGALDLPQDVTPTAATPARVIGLWEPSLQESIVAAYNFREELDQLILDISINNSQANASLAAVQPVLSFLTTTSAARTEGQRMGQSSGRPRPMAGVLTMQHGADSELEYF